MRLLYAIAPVVLAFFFPPALAAPSAKAAPPAKVTSAKTAPANPPPGKPPSVKPRPAKAIPICIPNSKLVLDSLQENFALEILTPAPSGKSKPKAPPRVGVDNYGLFSAVEVPIPVVGPSNGVGIVFSLKNKKLSVLYGFEAELLPQYYEISDTGLRSFVFGGPQTLPVNFTATKDCDKNGRSFLHLRGDNGKGEFAINGPDEGEQVFIKPPSFTGATIPVTLRIKPLTPEEIPLVQEFGRDLEGG